MDPLVRTGVAQMVDDAVFRTQNQRPAALKVSNVNVLGCSKVEHDDRGQPLAGANHVAGRLPISVHVCVDALCKSSPGDIYETLAELRLKYFVAIGNDCVCKPSSSGPLKGGAPVIRLTFPITEDYFSTEIL
jgi:hypothetical protein